MPTPRLVMRIPLDELWDDSGPLIAQRDRYLTEFELRELLRRGAVIFYVAEVGFPLRRIDHTECFDFWKSEVEPHLVDSPETQFHLEDFPDEYAYLGSEWTGTLSLRIVLFEKYH